MTYNGHYMSYGDLPCFDYLAKCKQNHDDNKVNEQKGH